MRTHLRHHEFWGDKLIIINYFFWKILLFVKKDAIKCINFKSSRSVIPTNKDKHMQHDIENPSWTTIIVGHRCIPLLWSICLISAYLKDESISSLKGARIERRLGHNQVGKLGLNSGCSRLSLDNHMLSFDWSALSEMISVATHSLPLDQTHVLNGQLRKRHCLWMDWNDLAPTH